VTFQNFHQPGATVIICAFEPQTIGSPGEDISGSGACDDSKIPHTILRQATLEEYLLTLKPQHRGWARENADPDALFYEVSVD
jgi:hypothetical protein